jgi:uncharacterized membrane protein YkvI
MQKEMQQILLIFVAAVFCFVSASQSKSVVTVNSTCSVSSPLAIIIYVSFYLLILPSILTVN